MEAIDEVKKECERFGYEAELRFGQIYVKTKIERWRFTPTNGKIRLMHANMRPTKSGDWHEQFRRGISYEDLVKYIHDHEVRKYGCEKK